MPFRTIAVALTGTNADLSSALRRAASDVDRFESTTRRSSTNVNRSTGLMSRGFRDLENVLSRGVTRSLVGFSAAAIGGYQAGRALNAAIRDVVGGAVQFDARMRNVNSISGLTEAQLGRLGGQVLDLSRNLPQSANALAEGLYDIASSGFQGAQGIEVLTASARAATAGLTDTATSAQAIAGVLNAYGEGADRARFVSDSLFQTVNLGVLSFEDLAQGIGQVVGTASAAGVSIDEVGQAIATITKGGIVPAEAFTSLNQLLAQIIQPGDALAAVFKQLGYESGAAALQSRGLAGVMHDIQRVTGGNVTTMSQLFDDTRSLRGALQLVANDGKLYAGVIRDWGAAHRGAGATATALAEQMKAVSAQWDLFKNRVHAAAIEAGTRLLPTLLDLIQAVQSLGHGGFDTLEEVISRLAPFFRSLRDVGLDLFRIFQDLYSAAAPLGKVLVGLAATTIITTLNGLATALAAVFNFVDHNRTTFEVLAGVIATLLLPSVVSLTGAMGRLVGLGVLNLFLGIGRVAGSATRGVEALTAAMGTLATAEGIATLGLTALVAVGAIGMYRLQKATQNAQAEVAKITDGFDPANFGAGIEMLQRLNRVATESAHKFNRLTWFQRGAANRGLGPGTQAAKDFDVASAAIDEYGAKLLNTARNANRLGEEIGVTGDVVLQYAAKNDIDLSKPWELSGNAIYKVKTGLKELSVTTGLSLGALKSAAGDDVDAMKALADAVASAQQAVAGAFASASDIITRFDPQGAAQGVQTAQQAVTDAEQRLGDLRARLADKDKLTVSDTQQLAHARRDVADATNELAKAQQNAHDVGSLQGVYDKEIQAGRAFLNNIQEVIDRGLDPQMVERLLEAGPEKAAPVLQQLVSDHSGRLIEMANRSEATLRRISSRVVEITRITTLAINSQTSRLSHDLPKALDIENALRDAGKRDLDALLQSLHMSPGEFDRISHEFGVILPRAVQRQLDKHPVHVRINQPHDSGGPYHHGGYATGGYVTGPGSGTSDSIPAWLSNGEFVMRASAVRAVGVSYLNRLNRYADGGPVSVAQPTPHVVRVVERSSHVTTHPITIGEVRAHDYRDFERQMRAKQRARKATER